MANLVSTFYVLDIFALTILCVYSAACLATYVSMGSDDEKILWMNGLSLTLGIVAMILVITIINNAYILIGIFVITCLIFIYLLSILY